MVWFGSLIGSVRCRTIHCSMGQKKIGNWVPETPAATPPFPDVVNYFEWLGEQVSDTADRREKFHAAAKVIHDQEKELTDAMLNGIDNVKGLSSIPNVKVIGGFDNPRREGLVAFWIEGADSADIVTHLNKHGVRTHLRKADHYSGNILDPLNQPSCVRVSTCHYNTVDEVKEFLLAMESFGT